MQKKIQNIFCNVEFCAKLTENRVSWGKKSSFEGKNQVLGFWAKSIFPRSTQKKPGIGKFLNIVKNTPSLVRIKLIVMLYSEQSLLVTPYINGISKLQFTALLVRKCRPDHKFPFPLIRFPNFSCLLFLETETVIYMFVYRIIFS